MLLEDIYAQQKNGEIVISDVFMMNKPAQTFTAPFTQIRGSMLLVNRRQGIMFNC